MTGEQSNSGVSAPAPAPASAQAPVPVSNATAKEIVDKIANKNKNKFKYKKRKLKGPKPTTKPFTDALPEPIRLLPLDKFTFKPIQIVKEEKTTDKKDGKKEGKKGEKDVEENKDQDVEMQDAENPSGPAQTTQKSTEKPSGESQEQPSQKSTQSREPIQAAQATQTAVPSTQPGAQPEQSAQPSQAVQPAKGAPTATDDKDKAKKIHDPRLPKTRAYHKHLKTYATVYGTRRYAQFIVCVGLDSRVLLFKTSEEFIPGGYLNHDEDEADGLKRVWNDIFHVGAPVDVDEEAEFKDVVAQWYRPELTDEVYPYKSRYLTSCQEHIKTYLVQLKRPLQVRYPAAFKELLVTDLYDVYDMKDPIVSSIPYLISRFDFTQ